MPGVRNAEFVIVAALALSFPSLLQAFSGGIGVAAAFVHIALALLVCWAGAAIIERVVDSYSRQARQRELEHRVQAVLEARAAQHGRHAPPQSAGGPGPAR